MRNRYTGRRALSRALRDWLTWVRASWLRRLLPGPLSGKHYQVRVDAHVLSAFPGNGHYRRAANTWSHLSRAGTSSEKLVIDPNPGLRPWGPVSTEGLRHRNLDQSRSARGTALWVAVPYAAQHAMSRFSSFVFKTSSHQEWWFDGLTWPNRPELHKIRCAARWRSLSKWPTGKQRIRTVFRCRTDSSVASIHATLSTRFENMLPVHRGGYPLCVAHTMIELLAHRPAPGLAARPPAF